MITPVHTWLVSHPLSEQLLFAVLGALLWATLVFLFKPRDGAFWRLAAIPPQRFSVWWTMARLANAEANLKRFHRACADPRYLLHLELLNLRDFMMALAILGFAEFATLKYSFSDPRWRDHPTVHDLYYLIFMALSEGMGTVVFFTRLAESTGMLRDVMVSPEAREKKLNEKVWRLKAKLGQ